MLSEPVSSTVPNRDVIDVSRLKKGCKNCIGPGLAIEKYLFSYPRVAEN